MCKDCKKYQVEIGKREIRIAQLEREIAVDRAFSGGLLWLSIILLAVGLWLWRGADLLSLINRPGAGPTAAEAGPARPPAQQPAQTQNSKKKK